MRNLRVSTLAKAFAISAALLLSSAIPTKAQRTYTVTDLGVAVAGGSLTDATDINNQGEAVGVTFVSGFPVFEEYGFVSKDGKITVLPALGGQSTSAASINQSGVVAGLAFRPGDTILHAAIWDRDLDRATDLGTLGGSFSSATWLNDRLEVVGESAISNGIDTHAFLWEKGTMSDLATLGGSLTIPFGINNSGLIVGQSDINRVPDPVFGIPQFHGAVWVREGQAIEDLGEIFGGHFNYAQGVNDRGEIVGAADLAGDPTAHAFMIHDGLLTDLGTVPGDTNSAVFAINNRGQAVGISALASPPRLFLPPSIAWLCPCHAAIWEDGKATDLNTLIPSGSGWQLTLGVAINDRGQIVGIGTFNNESRAFLLTPQEVNSSSAAATAASVNSAPEQASGASASAMRVTRVHGKLHIIMQR
jgi:probable HAF family extracellular repeat protein